MLVISVMATLMIIVAVAAEYTMTINRNVQRSNRLQSAIAIADGCLDYTFAHWRAACREMPSVAIKTNQLSGIPLPSVTQFPDAAMSAAGLPNFSVTASNYSAGSTTMVQQCKVVAVNPLFASIGADATPAPAIGPAATTADDAATTATFNYLATAYVTLPGMRGNLVAKVQRLFHKERASPWNWAIFYVDPLEIHPGPRFDVTGWVHTNSDLYTAHDTLWFQDKATFSGKWIINFKPGDSTHGGDIPAYPRYLANMKPQYDDPHQPTGIDSEQLFNTTDTNPNNDGYHELIEPPTSVSTNPDPLAGQRYYNQAGVIIEISGNTNPVTVTLKRPNGDGTARVINASSGGGPGDGKDDKVYDMFKTAIDTTTTTIQDTREAGPVRIATLDLSQIIDNDTKYEHPEFNGIIYIQDVTAAGYDRDNKGYGPNPNAPAKRGFRVKNGKQIPSVGLTIASANPVYLHGDFNTGYNPPSNTGDPTKPEGRLLDDGGADKGAYKRQPCSIIADAVNLLSNAWTGPTGTGAAASNTTYNTAIVSGIVPTGGGYYSGGAENFPRFQENWSTKTMAYYGSMVQLYQSKQAIGTWGKNGVYSPPVRRWYFDPNFKLRTPPGTLTVYSYTKGRWSLAP